MGKKAIVVRRAPMVSKAKYETLVRARAAVARKAREQASERVGMVVGVAAAGALGFANGRGWLDKVPQPGGIPTSFVVGGALAAVGMMMTGKASTYVLEAATATLAVGAYQMGSDASGSVGFDDDV
jgi:hypothetical protein